MKKKEERSTIQAQHQLFMLSALKSINTFRHNRNIEIKKKEAKSKHDIYYLHYLHRKALTLLV